MARPAGRANAYSGIWGSPGRVTGSVACSPLRAVTVSGARQASVLLVTATWSGAGKLILSRPHSVWCGCWRTGLDTETSQPLATGRDEVTRSAGGAVTVSVRRSGRGPVTWTSSPVRCPGDTGTRTRQVPGAVRVSCPSPATDTVRRLRISTCRPAGPPPGVSRTVTVFEAGCSTQATPGLPAADATAPWPIQAT